MDKCEVPGFSICWTTVVSLFWNRVPSRKGGFENMESDREKGECCWLEMVFIGTLWRWSLLEELLEYRFSAFWLRSKCSICSYQLNIWYEDYMSSSILNWFLKGDGLSGACSGSVASWPCIAVPQGSAHFPKNLSYFKNSICLYFHIKWPICCCLVILFC